MSNSGNYFNNNGNISNSNINLNQENIKNKHIEYFPNQETREEISDIKLKSELKMFYINLIIDSIAIFVNLISLVNGFTILKMFLLLGFIFYLIFVFIYFGQGIWLKNNSKMLETTQLYRDNYFYNKNSNGNFEKVKFQAKCIYPKCSGIISLIEAPERERENGHYLVGICSISGKQHSFSFDGNGIGYPKEFDWRPIEEKENTKK